MSLCFTMAPYCSSSNCTNQLTSRTEYLNKYCDLCMFELQEKWDKKDEEKRIAKELDE